MQQEEPEYFINPLRFRRLIGKGHQDFSTGAQQDAEEFLGHLLGKLDASEADAGRIATSVSNLFKFNMQERKQCAETGRVKYQLEDSIYHVKLQIPEDKVCARRDDNTCTVVVGTCLIVVRVVVYQWTCTCVCHISRISCIVTRGVLTTTTPPLPHSLTPSPLPSLCPVPSPLPSLSHPSPIPLPSLSHPSPIPLPSLSHPSPIPLPSLSSPPPPRARPPEVTNQPDVDAFQEREAKRQKGTIAETPAIRPAVPIADAMDKFAAR